MIHKNLLLLEYMVIKRIEKDTTRLETIRSISKMLTKAGLDLDNIQIKDRNVILEKLVAIKGKALNYFEHELIEEIFNSNKV